MRTPPSSRPIAPPPPAMAPKMPNALPRSGGSVKVVVSSDERRGREQRAEDALQRAGADEDAEALRGAADRRGDGEAEQAGDEHALAAEEVAEATAEQQQAAEGQGVGGDDPLAAVVGEAERVLGGRQGDVHDRRVEDDHELGDGEHGEDDPAPGVVEDGSGGGM